MAAARPGPDWRPEACGALSQASRRRGKAPPVRKTPWSDSSTLPPPLAGPSDPWSADTKMTAASGGARKGVQPRPFLWLGSPAPLPGPQCTTWEKTLALIVAALGGHARPKATTRFLAPHTHTSPPPAGGDLRARAPPPPGASQRPFVPPSPGTQVPEKFQEKNQRKRQKKKKKIERCGAGRVGGAGPRRPEVSLPRPQGQGSVLGSRRTHRSPRLHLVVGEVGFFFLFKSRSVARQAQRLKAAGEQGLGFLLRPKPGLGVPASEVPPPDRSG